MPDARQSDVSDDQLAPDNVYGDTADPWTIATWMGETYRADKRAYEPADRPLSLDRLAGVASPNLDAPVFLVGSPRSGTSFLGEAIGEMPSVSYHHEPIATKAATRFVWEERWDSDEAARFFRRVFGFLMAIHLDGDLRFAQKTPRHAFVADLLYEAFASPKLIHLIRDGRDVTASYVEKPWLSEDAGPDQVDPGGAPHGPYPRFWVEPGRRREFRETTDAHRCIWSWRRHVEVARETFERLPEPATLTLRYERLVEAPDPTADEILEFVDVTDADDREALHRALSEVRSDSVGRGTRELTDDQLETVDEEAGDLLESLGY